MQKLVGVKTRSVQKMFCIKIVGVTLVGAKWAGAKSGQQTMLGPIDSQGKNNELA